jgi:hypothetical protein
MWVDLQQTIGPLAGQEDRHVGERHHTLFHHEFWNPESILFVNVLRDDGSACVDCIGLRGVLFHGDVHAADQIRAPTDVDTQEK